MKKGILLFAVYIVVLVLIGVQSFTRAGESSHKKISIYKEAVPKDIETAESDGADTQPQAEAGNLNAEDMQAEAGSSNAEDIQAEAGNLDVENTQPQMLELTQTVKMKQIEQTGEEQEYNGAVLQDNGLPYAVKINRQENIVTVYRLDDEGSYTIPVKAMLCSVSLDDTTPVGLFTTKEKRLEWAYLQGDVYGQYAYQIYEGIYFHSVPYTSNDNANMETWEFNKLGEGASLGCIRLCVADAKWIFDNCEPGTQVNIFDSDYCGPMGRPQQPYLFTDVSDTGWDPTDTADGNPFAGTAVIYGAVSHSIEAGEPFDSKAGILAFTSEMENVTDQVMVEGTVDTSTPGEYKLTYSFMDNGNRFLKDIFITVADTTPPAIEMAPEELHLSGYTGDKEDLAEFVAGYITAWDAETLIMESVTVDAGIRQEQASNTSKAVLVIDVSDVQETPGTYQVSCRAEDEQGNASAEVKISIVLEE